MARTITQKIVFKGIEASALYELYLNAKQHSVAIGAPVSIQNKEGTKFSAHDKYITGKTLQLKKNQLIVQSWRGSDWNESEPDSTFILRFEQNGKDGTIHMVHANVPDKHFSGIKEGWNEFYWFPWKNYLSAKQKK